MSILIAISGIIGGIIFRTQHVFLRNTVYKKDVKELSLNYQGVDVDELNKCSELESLKIWGVNDDFLTEIKTFQHLKSLYIIDCNIFDEGISKVNMFPNLNYIFILNSRIDFGKIQNDSITETALLNSEISNLTGLANCRSLKCLWITSTAIDDKIVVTEGTHILNQKYCLKDSSDFSCLDNIIDLTVCKIDIEDISGFMEMDSLETLTVSEECISEDNIKTLENNGITVIKKDTQE